MKRETITVPGNELNATLQRLRGEGKAWQWLDVGRTNGEWIITLAEPQQQQGLFDERKERTGACQNPVAQQKD